MRKDFGKLIEKVLNSLDWDTIFEIHKVFKFGVGEGSEAVPGLKRKIFNDSLNKNDVKNELKLLLKFVINNDISKFMYGPWMITWFNQDWEVIFDNEDEEDFVDDVLEDIQFHSTLDVVYAPQRICVSVNAAPDVNEEMTSEEGILNKMLKRALKSENYELAGKIQEILDEKSKTKLDK
jgi:hypothetical protein